MKDSVIEIPKMNDDKTVTIKFMKDETIMIV